MSARACILSSGHFICPRLFLPPATAAGSYLLFLSHPLRNLSSATASAAASSSRAPPLSHPRTPLSLRDGGRSLERAHLFHKGNNEIVSVEKLPTCFIIRGSPAEGEEEESHLRCADCRGRRCSCFTCIPFHAPRTALRAHAGPPTTVESTLTAMLQWMMPLPLPPPIIM